MQESQGKMVSFPFPTPECVTCILPWCNNTWLGMELVRGSLPCCLLGFVTGPGMRLAVLRMRPADLGMRPAGLGMRVVAVWLWAMPVSGRCTQFQLLLTCPRLCFLCILSPRWGQTFDPDDPACQEQRDQSPWSIPWAGKLSGNTPWTIPYILHIIHTKGMGQYWDVEITQAICCSTYVRRYYFVLLR